MHLVEKGCKIDAGKPRGAHSEESSVLEVQYRVDHSAAAAASATEVGCLDAKRHCLTTRGTGEQFVMS